MNIKQFFIPGIVIVILASMLFIAFGRNTVSDNTNQQSLIEDERVGATNYITYSPENLKNAQENGRTILYFWASWCPTCKILDQELKERGTELPGNVTILQVNYDAAKELKQKYQITQQHTLVQIDKDGNEVTKWIGGNLDVIKEQLK